MLDLPPSIVEVFFLSNLGFSLCTRCSSALLLWAVGGKLEYPATQNVTLVQSLCDPAWLFICCLEGSSEGRLLRTCPWFRNYSSESF